jgi:hypothetical protein
MATSEITSNIHSEIRRLVLLVSSSQIEDPGLYTEIFRELYRYWESYIPQEIKDRHPDINIGNPQFNLKNPFFLQQIFSKAAELEKAESELTAVPAQETIEKGLQLQAQQKETLDQIKAENEARIERLKAKLPVLSEPERQTYKNEFNSLASSIEETLPEDLPEEASKAIALSTTLNVYEQLKDTSDKVDANEIVAQISIWVSEENSSFKEIVDHIERVQEEGLPRVLEVEYQVSQIDSEIKSKLASLPTDERQILNDAILAIEETVKESLPAELDKDKEAKLISRNIIYQKITFETTRVKPKSEKDASVPQITKEDRDQVHRQLVSQQLEHLNIPPEKLEKISTRVTETLAQSTSIVEKLPVSESRTQPAKELDGREIFIYLRGPGGHPINRAVSGDLTQTLIVPDPVLTKIFIRELKAKDPKVIEQLLVPSVILYSHGYTAAEVKSAADQAQLKNHRSSVRLKEIANFMYLSESGEYGAETKKIITRYVLKDLNPPSGVAVSLTFDQPKENISAIKVSPRGNSYDLTFVRFTAKSLENKAQEFAYSQAKGKAYRLVQKYAPEAVGKYLLKTAGREAVTKAAQAAAVKVGAAIGTKLGISLAALGIEAAAGPPGWVVALVQIALQVAYEVGKWTIGKLYNAANNMFSSIFGVSIKKASAKTMFAGSVGTGVIGLGLIASGNVILGGILLGVGVLGAFIFGGRSFSQEDFLSMSMIGGVFGSIIGLFQAPLVAAGKISGGFIGIVVIFTLITIFTSHSAFLTGVNRSALLGPAQGSRYINVTKTVSSTVLPNSALPTTITYTITVSAQGESLSNVLVSDETTSYGVGNPTIPNPPGTNQTWTVGNLDVGGSSWTTTYDLPLNNSFEDSIVTNIVTVSGDVNGNRESKTSVVTVIIGNPPQCPPTLHPVSGSVTNPFSVLPNPSQCSSSMSSSNYCHPGVDIGADLGTSVTSPFACPAVVVHAQSGDGCFGNTVTLQSGNHFAYLAHLAAYSVSVGQTVNPGETVGLVDSTGCSTGHHLHYEVRINGSPGSNWEPGKAIPPSGY